MTRRGPTGAGRSEVTAKRRLRISLASVALLGLLLVLTDWSAGGWKSAVGILVALAFAANLWGAFAAWRALRR